MELVSDREYSCPDGAPLKFDLCHPGGGPTPLAVFLHGGGWMSGDRGMFRDEALWLARQGFAAAVIDYRLAPLHPFPAAVVDAQSFVRFARQNAEELKIKPDKIAAIGNSSGGHLACMLGLCNETFGSESSVDHKANAVVDICGLTDMRDPGDTQFDASFGFIEQFLGGPYAGNEERYAQASPLAHLTDAVCPFLIVHGDQDDVVPPNQSAALHEALTKAGGKSSLIMLEGEGHSFTFGAWDRVREAYLAFLRDVL